MQVLGWTRDQQKKLSLTVLERFYTKSLHRKRRLCKKGHRVTRLSFTCYWHRFGQQTSKGTAHSVKGEQPPTMLKCFSWVLLCLLWLGFNRLFVIWSTVQFWLSCCSVTHLLGDLMRVEDARDRHLDLVFLLLGLTERCLPLLQEQV